MLATKQCIVLLSGGLDSATVLAIAASDGYSCRTLTVSYGQRHQSECAAAAKIAAHLGAMEHREMLLDLRVFGGSAITADLPIPQDRSEREMEQSVPPTFVPARNTILLSLALAYAESCQIQDIFVGFNASDHAGYPDCRPAFVQAFQSLTRVATKTGNEVRIHAPLIYLFKPSIIRLGISLGVDYSLTSSCYMPAQDSACGRCDACVLRRKGFASVGVPDPVPYT